MRPVALRADVRDLGETGEDPAGIDDVAVFPALDEDRGIVRLGRARLRTAARADDEVGDEAEHRDGRPVSGLGRGARLEDDLLEERRVIFSADAQADLGILPVPAVARLIEHGPFPAQGMVDLDPPRGRGNAVLEHRDRARPVLDASAGIMIGFEAVEPDRRRPAGDRADAPTARTMSRRLPGRSDASGE
jgi:hypothetical protein